MNEQTINCPDCSTPIPFDPYALVQGKQFVCPNCSASIGIDQGSRETVKNALDQFESMRSRLGKQP